MNESINESMSESTSNAQLQCYNTEFLTGTVDCVSRVAILRWIEFGGLAGHSHFHDARSSNPPPPSFNISPHRSL
jgi:hypothetical protein